MQRINIYNGIQDCRANILTGGINTVLMAVWAVEHAKMFVNMML